MKIEQVNELYEFLQAKNKEIGTLTFKSVPKLSSRKAFSVIYFLQEHMHLIPDTFERCATCGDLYDSSNEGNFPHCEQHRRD